MSTVRLNSYWCHEADMTSSTLDETSSRPVEKNRWYINYDFVFRTKENMFGILWSCVHLYHVYYFVIVDNVWGHLSNTSAKTKSSVRSPQKLLSLIHKISSRRRVPVRYIFNSIVRVYSLFRMRRWQCFYFQNKIKHSLDTSIHFF